MSTGAVEHAHGHEVSWGGVLFDSRIAPPTSRGGATSILRELRTSNPM